MKYDWKLDDIDNSKRWYEHWRSVKTHTSFNDLTKTEKLWLRDFNLKLIDFENRYAPIVAERILFYRARQANPNDWLNDFNLMPRVVFYLGEDDPEYEADDDNILCVMRPALPLNDKNEPYPNLGFGSTTVHHSDPRVPDSEIPVICYTLHHLIDHCDLDLRDIFRIGFIWFELNIDEQTGMLSV
jgi:hypothetical protein